MTAKLLTGTGVCVAVVALTAALAVYQLRPPDAAPPDAPPAEFSSVRAMRHVEVIAREPHPVGSAAHEQVRQYILGELSALGLAAEAQEANGVRNILVRLEGSEPGKAVLLVAHYDSVKGSPGAADDGSAVAALLETLRALRAGARLRNEVVCLFTDAEEVGLKGAEAFVYARPRAADAGLVLNFDARGNGGPALMFETSRDNGWLVEQFARASTHPRATSLSYDIYKLLGNDTDFTVFKEAGIAGLNFALVEGGGSYHSARDTSENLDRRSLQHQGSTALALARHFGGLDLTKVRSEGDAVFFNLVGYGLVFYPQKWAAPIAAVSALAFVVLIALGRRKGRVTVYGAAKGFAACVLNVVAVLVVLWLAGAAAGQRGGNVQTLLMVALAAASAACFHVWLGRALRPGAGGMLAGGLACWLALALATSLFLTGGSYLFVWPLLCGLAASAYLWSFGPGRGAWAGRLIALTACAVPAAALPAPLVYLSLKTFTAGSALSAVVVAVPVVLVTSLLAPQLAAAPPHEVPSGSVGGYAATHV
ncbi:MAG TPA: M28 family peptidase [Pyrinomonadaceae bacterium]|jgi:hypothetical protein